MLPSKALLPSWTAPSECCFLGPFLLRCRTLPFTSLNFLGFLPWLDSVSLQTCRPGNGQHAFFGGAAQ